MNKISRKGFLKIAAAAAMSGVTAGALAACNAAKLLHRRFLPVQQAPTPPVPTPALPRAFPLPSKSP